MPYKSDLDVYLKKKKEGLLHFMTLKKGQRVTMSEDLQLFFDFIFTEIYINDKEITESLHELHTRGGAN